MARQPKWTSERAIEYLAGSSLKPAKPLSEYKTPELKRKASVYQKAEREGRSVQPGEARGHQKPTPPTGGGVITPPKQPRAKIRHIEARPKGTVGPSGKGVLPPRPEQYSVGTREQPATPAQARRMLASRSKERKKEGEAPIRGRNNTLTGNITGILDQKYGHVEAGSPITLSFHITRDQFNKLMHDMQAGKLSLVDVANALSMQGGMGNLTGAHWVDAWQMNIHV